MRYTLRALTEQQFVRASSMIMACNVLRKNNETFGSTPFSVGMWVGDTAIANKYSEGKESSNGGIIGPVSISNVHPLLAKLLQISKKDQLWKPRKIENWWVVVRLEEIRNTELNDQIKNMLSLELGNNFLNSEFEKLIKVNQENTNKDKQLLNQ